MSSTAESFPVSDRTRHQRMPKRGSHDRELVYRIIDAAPICQVGIVMDGQPFVMPTIHVRIGDKLYLHGANQSRLIQVMASGAPVCVTFVLLDALVIARSVVHNSMNYRSAMAFGTGRKIETPEEKMPIFEALTEKLTPGRWAECKWPTPPEIAMTAVVEIAIDEASSKVREGPPVDVPGDMALPHWAGIIPVATRYGSPEPDPQLAPAMQCPGHIQRLAGTEV